MKVMLWALLLACTPVLAQDQDLLERLNRMESDMVLMQRKLYTGSGDRQDGALLDEIYTKLDKQEGMIGELTDKIETLEHDLKQTQEKLDLLSKDIDVRFKMQGTKPMPEGDLKSAPTPKHGALVPAGTSPKALYDGAYEALKEGDFVKAEQGFSAFMEKYPKDKLVGNANYWLGETYYARGMYAEAVGIFASGVTTYKDNIKAPDNLLKLGLSMQKLGKKDEACTAFKTLPKEFPKAAQSLKDRAVAEAKKISCP